MIGQAIEHRASDIHIEPFEKEFRVRFRVDGVLFNQEAPPRELKSAIISRLKLMAKLNIAERRLPQDGRIKIKILGREVDLRVSTLPTLYGESVVMRLLDRSAGDFYDLRRLGFDDFMLGPHGALHFPAPRHLPGHRAPQAAANPPRYIRRSSASIFRTRKSSPSKTPSNTRWMASTRSM
jgi:general secretion pathway protein E